jgi:hypothetical protein
MVYGNYVMFLGFCRLIIALIAVIGGILKLNKGRIIVIVVETAFFYLRIFPIIMRRLLEFNLEKYEYI